jgi:hypothetical protein
MTASRLRASVASTLENHPIYQDLALSGELRASARLAQIRLVIGCEERNLLLGMSGIVEAASRFEQTRLQAG